ncbi:hypothetical protein ASD16_03315 [Cellulomonas sp. Root485]|uniref:FtsK/SpoIIIE domain-containing protein n=1 Tax=Cellulomonas sp. Root485 TaxID=1736546 RepID=UPI0006F2F046|nr:FtsK/SpoIIIE domain-containing protein [Cellulomonas sp. Root485]KQY24569.1 hypothetical protein ASD16_03315 [Cellulomonas sp. Root485]
MRFTLLHPDPSRGHGLVPTDVEADVGTALSVLRPGLARVSGYAGWASAGVRAAVADAVLDEHHVVGQPPLVEGCVLRVGPGSRTGSELAVRADWHVAVVAGPDSGGLAAVPTDGTLTVGPDAGAAALTVHDAALPRVQIRRRRGDKVSVRVGEGLRWRRWRSHRTLDLGTTTLALRGPADGSAAGARAPEPGYASRPATWLAPLLGSVALAVALRQPVLLLVGLAVPLVALATDAVARLRLRRRSSGDPCLRDLAALVAATARAGVSTTEPVVLDQPWDPGGSLAVVGPRALALPVARAIALGALGTHLTAALAVRTRWTDDWTWCVWATAPDAPLPLGPADGLVVADDPPDPAALARWRSSSPASQRLLLLADSGAAVPAWCRARIEVGARSVRLHGADGKVLELPRQAAGAELALTQVRAAASARALAVAVHDTALPVRASLAGLDGIPAPDQVSRSWATPRRGLVVALGVGPGGRTVSVDLVADGPHALVAGTTGAGKSELLTTVVLALALTHPPDRLAILLVDFKGGTGLGPVAGLPHVLEHVTDLDAAHARRVLASLRAELRRREAILAAAGARDLLELDPADPTTPPRLLVVVDELRALTEDVTDASAALTRIAAQGRALGVHLVLATQRPAGAVGADLRANVALRIALRVTDPADSTDVLDAPDAARLDPATPGRAWVRRGTRPLEPVQVARAVAAAAVPPVRLARAWSDAGTAWSPAPSAGPHDDDLRPAWLRAAAQAATRRPAGGGCPWLPALPAVARAADVDDGPGLALAVADVPDEQRRGAVRWDPADGPLLVLGGPRSGRTTTLVAAGLEALDHGWSVHAVGLPPAAVHRLRAGDRHRRLGSTLETDDARAVARLLELLTTTGRPQVLLLVDRLDLLLDSLGRLARGAGVDRLTTLWRSSTAATALVAGADAGAAAMQHAGAFAHRLVLPLADAALDALAGVPAALAGRRTTPGRAVHLHATGAELCQVVLPEPPAAGVVARSAEEYASGLAAGPAERHRDPAVVLVRPLPERADLPPGLGAGPGRLEVPLGLGGDDASVVRVDVSQGLLVAGPPGSGRSTALSVVARTLVRGGVRVLRVVDPAGLPVPALAGVQDVGPADVGVACGADGAVLLVDDLDDLQRAHPGLDELIPPTVSLVAGVTSSSAAQAFRGTVATLVRRRRVLVLDAHDHASAELVGPRAAWCVDPSRRPAGRGVLLTGRAAIVVQVYAGGS